MSMHSNSLKKKRSGTVKIRPNDNPHNLISLLLAVANIPPFGLKSTELTWSLRSSSVLTNCPYLRVHIRAKPSREPLATHFASFARAMVVISATWPVYSTGGMASAVICHFLIEFPPQPTNRLPLGENTRDLTGPYSPSSFRSNVPVRTSQILTIESLQPVAIDCESGDTARLTAAACGPSPAR